MGLGTAIGMQESSVTSLVERNLLPDAYPRPQISRSAFAHTTATGHQNRRMLHFPCYPTAPASSPRATTKTKTMQVPTTAPNMGQHRTCMHLQHTDVQKKCPCETTPQLKNRPVIYWLQKILETEKRGGGGALRAQVGPLFTSLPLRLSAWQRLEQPNLNTAE